MTAHSLRRAFGPVAAILLLACAIPLHAAVVSNVQHGTAVSNGNGTLTVNLGQAVNPSSTVLFFSTRHAETDPGDTTVRGRLADASTLEFVRVTNSSEALPISWYLVEFASGVQVQRGEVSQSGNTLDVNLAQPVASTAQAFVLYSKTPAAGDTEWGSNDPLGGYLRSNSQIRFRTENSSSHTIAYQVVEFTDSADVLVQSGDTNVGNNDDVIDINLPQAVDPANTFVLAGHTINNGGDDIERRLFRGEVVDGNTVRFTREATGNDIGRLVWQVIELKDGSRVMHGTESFPYNWPFTFTTSATVNLPQTVDVNRSVAFSGMQSWGGQAMGSAEESVFGNYPGISSYTFDLSSDQLVIERDSRYGTGHVGWFVVEFNDVAAEPTPVLDVPMNELFWDGTAGEVTDEVAGNNGTAQDDADTRGADPALTGNPGTCRYGDFDGSADHVAFADAPHLDITGELTVAVWINTRTIPLTGLKSIVSKDTNYEFHVDNAGRIYWWWNDSNGNVRSFTGGSVSTDTWHHVAITYRSGEQVIYLDGVAVASASYTGTLATNNLPLQVGQDQGFAGRFFDGYIDELKIFDQALDATEVQDVMNERRPCLEQPVGEWRFDESGWNGTPDEVLDSSGNGHHGRAIGTVSDTGLVCNAADLTADAPDDYVELDPTAFDGLDDFTMAGWYRGTQSDAITVVSGANASVMNEVLFFFRDPDNFDPHLKNSNRPDLNTPVTIDDGDWHFLAWTRNGDTSCLYVDDQSGGCRNNFPSGTLDVDFVTVGEEQDSLGGGFDDAQDLDGYLDELLLFDRVLSAGELATIRANHLAGDNWDGTPRTCPVVGATGFQIGHDGAGIHCTDEPVTVSAVDGGGSVVASYAGEVTLDTGTGRGTWSVATGNGTLTDAAADDGLATYLFDPADNGVVTLALTYPEGPAAMDIEVYQTSDNTIRDDDTEGTLTFAPSGFTLTAGALSNPPPSPVDDPVATQTAGASFPLHITAYGVTDDDPQCGVIENYTGSRNLTFDMGWVNPGSGPLVAAVDGQATNTGLPQAVTFTAGQAQVSVKYKDVGAINLQATDASSFANTLTGGSNDFVVRPADLVVTRVESPGGVVNPGAATATGPGFIAAGALFEADVDAIDAEGDRTPSYGQESTPEGVRLALAGVDVPAGGAGSLQNGTAFSYSGVPGRFTDTTLWFDDVGVIRVTARVADGDYLGTGAVTGTPSGPVGRFHPAGFSLASGSVTPACGTFTYMDQPALGVQYVLQALNAGGNVTANYDTSLLGASAVANVGHVAEAADGGVDLGGRLSPFAGPWTAGQVVVNRPDVAFARLAAPDGPYDPLQLAVTVTDSLDGVTLTGLDTNASTSGDCVAAGNCSARAIGAGSRVVYGRLAVLPNSGPENENLSVPLAAQMFTGAAFELNPADVCSVYAAGGMGLAAFTGNLASGETSAIAPVGTATLTGGAADPANPPTLSAPGFGNDGSVDVTLDVDAWLEFDWLGTGATDPVATASFGRFRGHDRIIFWSEPR